MSENSRVRASAHRPRHDLSSWARWLTRPGILGTVCGVISVLLAALALHNNLVTIATAAATAIGALVAIAVIGFDRDRRRLRKLTGLARQLVVEGPPYLIPLPLDAEDRTPLIDDLEKLLRGDEWLCVVRLHGSGTLHPRLGIANDAIPLSEQCRGIVGAISWQLEKAAGLRDPEALGKALRGVANRSRQDGAPIDALRREVVRTLRKWDRAADRLVPLAEARKQDLELPAGKWLRDLFEDLRRRYGVAYTQESDDSIQSPDDDDGQARPRNIRRRGPWEQDYVSEKLRTWLSEREVTEVFQPLRDSVGDELDVDLTLLDIRCAVIAAAVELREQAEPLGRLINPGSQLPATPAEQRREAALAVRHLIDRKASHLAGRGVTGVFDRLVVAGLVTSHMLGELTRDLGLSTEQAGTLYDWLRDDEPLTWIVVTSAAGIRLGETIERAALEWFRNDERSAAYQDYQVAAESYYRLCLVMDRTNLPASRYEYLVAPGYGGLHLYEIGEWWQNFYIWGDHAERVASADNRENAGIAITCLFLETWWWWGDQLRLGYLDEVLGLARKILRDQREWVSALERFDDNYLPELDQRGGAEERWAHVANALGYLGGRIGLVRGVVPADPVLARIYICWSFFNGDAAQQSGELEAADAWFSQAAVACGDDEDNAAMRAFASYQRADVWIPSDPDRAMRVIRETGVAGAAVALKDLSLSAYVARMYGDIRWESGDIDGAFDAYGRTMLLTYAYQVNQETAEIPPNKYSFALYKEMRTRFQRRLSEAREKGLNAQADSAIERIRRLFGPYWELKTAAITAGEDPLTGIVPPLPDQTLLETFDSGYAKDALLMLNDKLKDRIAEPVTQRLRMPGDPRTPEES